MSEPSPLRIYYDGGCYFCQRYADLVQLRSLAGGVKLISLRDGSPEAVAIIEAGHAVNTGFVVEHEGHILKGAQAFAYLNGMLDPKDWLSRVMMWTGGNPKVATFLYPVLVAMRMVFLALQGRALIDRDNPLNNRSVLDESLGVRALRLAPLSVFVTGMLGAVFGPGLDRAVTSDLHLLRMLVVAAIGLVGFVLVFRRQELAIQLYDRLRYGGWVPLLGLVTGWLALVHLPELIVFRRFIGLFAAFPVLGILLDLSCEKWREGRHPKVVAAYPLFVALFVLVPGWNFPPFYGGIAGWAAFVDKNQPIRQSGLKLVNRNGTEIWYNHALMQPHTQIGRFRRAFISEAGDQMDYMAFAHQNYLRVYPMLERGRLPHQWALGELAYPTHNLSDSNADEYAPEFAPEELVAIRYVLETYDWDGTRIEHRILRELPVP